jgi:hypothetical protein
MARNHMKNSKSRSETGSNTPSEAEKKSSNSVAYGMAVKTIKRLQRFSPCIALLVALGFTRVVSAQTIITGPTISGTWSPPGNPYIVSGNVTVPSGQILTIQPGVVVWIGSGISITNNGLIYAVGTPSQRITFQAPISSQYWNTIMNKNAGVTNLFTYCDFVNAQTALFMISVGNNMSADILNCTFSNCLSQGVYATTQGIAWECIPEGGCATDATNTLVIKNCFFSTSSNGCVMNIFGAESYGAVGYGSAYPAICGNIFQNLTGSAFVMTAGSYAGAAQPTFVNNTIVGCRGGINATDPWDALVQDNIFVGCTNAVVDSGSLSRSVSYNDFYNNVTNFIGYLSTYGTWIIPNRNGTISDLLYNISQNPLFIATNDFHLTNSSPCVNAGTPNWAYANMCVPPSIATNFPDLGAYGGPDACNWLSVVPLLPASASISMDTNNVVSILLGAIPRSEYQLQFSTNLFSTNRPSTNWANLPNGLVLAIQKPTSVIIATNATAPQEYFRAQSLGRTPGN